MVLFVLKRPKINEKEAGDGPFFLKKENSIAVLLGNPLLGMAWSISGKKFLNNDQTLTSLLKLV